jgi:sec-independent protein translocase protein TatC
MTEQPAPAAKGTGEPEQTLVSHLVELRNRLLRSIVVVVLVFVAMFPFANQLYQILAEPLLAHLPSGAQMVAIDVVTPFVTPLKLAFFSAVFLAMPFLLYQAWAFIAPGLYRNEKRLAAPILVSAVLLFYVGCAFAYFAVMPMVFGFLTATVPDGVAMMTDISRYLDFALVMFLVFGLCFEVPVATVIVAVLGVATPEQMKDARGYVIVGAFVVAAVVTPPDVISQIMLAVPMCLLFEIGLVAARIATRKTDAEAPSR